MQPRQDPHPTRASAVQRILYMCLMYCYFRFRMAIIGGGPAGTAIIVRAIRLGHIAELCGQSLTSAGVCIIDKNPLNRFGGGRLLDFEVRSKYQECLLFLIAHFAFID